MGGVGGGVCEGELGVVMGCRWVIDALVEVREVEPGDVCVWKV